MAKLVSRKPADPNVPNDSPATQAWVSTHYGSKTDNTQQDFNGKIKAPDVITPINVKYFGAKGNGTHDDTKAIQAAINTLGSGGRVYFPKGTYLISSAILIPASSQWVICGDSRGNTIIQQSASNTPIFKITHNLTFGWAIQDISFIASTQQASTNVQAAGVMVTNSANVFNWIIERCHFNFLANGLYADANTVVWGGTMRDIIVNSSQTRSVAQIVAGGGGFPNNKFINIYILATSMVGPLFDFAGCLNTWITGVEINNALLGPCLLKDTAGGSYSIGTFKLEVGTYSTSVSPSAMFQLANSQLFAQYIELLTITANLTGATFPANSILRNDSGASKIRIARLDHGGTGWTVTNGSFYVMSGAASGLDCEIDSMDLLQTNMVLTAIGSEAAADHIQVRSWNDNQVSADQGDASVTVTPGPTQANVLSFETILTAARTVTLPTANAAGSMFNGLTYTVRATPGITVNFALNINNGLALLDTIPVGKSGTIQYTYRHNAWVQTLKAIF